MKRAARACWIVLAAAVALPAASQSLGEAARREKERRAQVKKPAKVVTEADLKPGEPTEEPAESLPPVDTTSPDAVASRGGSPQEATWRQKARQAHEAVSQAEQRVKDAEARLEALRLDMDPTKGALDASRLQRLEAERQAAQQDVEQARAQLQQAKQALETLEEEARRNSIPPGWLRLP